MKYISTRGGVEPVDFVTACLSGLAPDGGLYVPDVWPQIEPARADEPYVSVATRILSAMAGEALDASTVQTLCSQAYASFQHPAVTPLVQYGPNAWLLELHHGPTLAFKDIAMQFIGALYDYALSRQNRRLSVLCATSGDTGGAAAAAFAGSAHVDLTILHPHERIAPVQRLFMTTTGEKNVQNLALTGDFDDCQRIVKGMFADPGFAQSVGLSGVNSINWARIAAQTVYFAMAQAALGENRPLRFIVPSGNMGDALAGYVAARCGLLGGGLEIVCAVNENKALETIFSTGTMRREKAKATPSPAMDISVPSNFERLLFEAAGRDPDTVKRVYDSFVQSGDVTFDKAISGPLGCMGFKAVSVSNEDTLSEMRRFLDETGMLICPHTAVGTHVARNLVPSDTANIVLATAHAAKFPEIVKQATGQEVRLPARVRADLFQSEAFDIISPEDKIVRQAVSDLFSSAS